MAKAKHLYFAAAAPDGTASTEQVVMFPATQVSHYEMASATSLRVYFNSNQEQDLSGVDSAHAVLTIASGKYKDALTDLAKAIADPYGDALITVADEVNSKYASSHITACASISVVDAS